MTTEEARTGDDTVVIPEGATRRETGVTLAELLSSFYLWLVLWLVAWAAVPALVLAWQPVLITSGSMGPTVSPGDIILIGEPPADELLSQGAVITFPDPDVPGGLVTHRIDLVREDGLYRTRGDANGSPDAAPVHPDDVVGVGRLLVPLVGLPVMWLRTDMLSFGLFLGGSIAAVIVAGSANRAGHRRTGGGDATASPDAADGEQPS